MGTHEGRVPIDLRKHTASIPAGGHLCTFGGPFLCGVPAQPAAEPGSSALPGLFGEHTHTAGRQETAVCIVPTSPLLSTAFCSMSPVLTRPGSSSSSDDDTASMRLTAEHLPSLVQDATESLRPVRFGLIGVGCIGACALGARGGAGRGLYQPCSCSPAGGPRAPALRCSPAGPLPPRP